MKKYQLTIYILFLVFQSFANIDLKNDHLNDIELLHHKVSYYTDTTNTITADKIYNNESLFTETHKQLINFGSNGNNNWIKIDITNDSIPKHYILNISNPTLDKVVFYKKKNNILDSITLNNDSYLINRSFYHQFYTFDILLDSATTYTYYLKINSSKQLLIPFSIKTPNQVTTELMEYDLSSGVYMGIMLSMILYNLFIYISSREKYYLVYVNYIFWVAIVQVAILGYFQRLSNLPVLNSINFIAFTGAMSGIGSVFFVKSFLNIKKYPSILTILLNTIVIGDLLAIGLILTNQSELSYQIVNLVAGIGSIIVLFVGWKIYKLGNKNAKIFLIAWGIFLFSVLIYVLKDYDILPYNFFTLHAVQIGSSIEALILSFALGNIINIYRKEKEYSQLQTLRISQENERLIREQNIELERKVNQRTTDLKKSNLSLKKTLKNLKEAQSQLVESEKMASLGQLTAGVAHEINNPINFVTANVTPLKRDINMLWETLHNIENIAYEQTHIDDKKRKIKDIKEDIDFDYLKIEVEHLLKGMHEGASRTAEIVKSLRIFSRVDEDNLNFTDLNEGIESTLIILNTLIKDKIKIEKNYSTLPLVECYAGKLNQVFLNILSNAIYAVEKRFFNMAGAEIIVNTIYNEHKETVSIFFIDNGIGIPKKIQNKIFDPFFTTKNVGEGTGLGMSIAYKTIEKHNGKINLQSVEGQGTTFELVLPIKQS